VPRVPDQVKKHQFPRSFSLREKTECYYIMQDTLNAGLVDAINRGELNGVKQALDAGANVNFHEEDQDATPLFFAVSQPGDMSEIVKLLLERGAKLEAVDENGSNALMFASSYAPPNVVKLLLEKGANVNKQDEKGITALMRAAKQDRTDVIRILVEAGANVSIKDKRGKTASTYASAGTAAIIDEYERSKAIEEGVNQNLSRGVGFPVEIPEVVRKIKGYAAGRRTKKKISKKKNTRRSKNKKK